MKSFIRKVELRIGINFPKKFICLNVLSPLTPHLSKVGGYIPPAPMVVPPMGSRVEKKLKTIDLSSREIEEKRAGFGGTN